MRHYSKAEFIEFFKNPFLHAQVASRIYINPVSNEFVYDFTSPATESKPENVDNNDPEIRQFGEDKMKNEDLRNLPKPDVLRSSSASISPEAYTVESCGEENLEEKKSGDEGKLENSIELRKMNKIDFLSHLKRIKLSISEAPIEERHIKAYTRPDDSNIQSKQNDEECEYSISKNVQKSTKKRRKSEPADPKINAESFRQRTKRQRSERQTKDMRQKSQVCFFYLIGSCQKSSKQCRNDHPEFQNESYVPLCASVTKDFRLLVTTVGEKVDPRKLCPKKDCPYSHDPAYTPCKHFFSDTKGSCSMRDNCIFTHDPKANTARLEFEAKYSQAMMKRTLETLEELRLKEAKSETEMNFDITKRIQSLFFTSP